MTTDLDTLRIEDLIPHKGRMCLWQQVRAFDAAHIALETRTHQSADNPLRSNGELRAVHLCEYGAQAMAVHGGLRAQSGGAARKGFLVALRGVEIHVPRLDTLHEALHCEAQLLMEGEASQQYLFRLTHAGMCIAEGRAAVMLAPTGE